LNTNKDSKRIVEVDEVNFESEVLRSEPPVLAVFLAPWSRPCQLMESVLDEVMTACTGTVKFVKINADNNPDLGIWYEIQSVPTLLYFVNGSLRARIVGTTSKETILSRMQLTLPREPTSLISKSKEK
jgi:thioredoxin-like negative regulator of GroEL